MRRGTTLCLAVSVMVVLLSGTAARAGEENGSSPFLIAEGLPHLTKILMVQWENPALKLTEKQKEKLLVVRKATMLAVKKISPQAEALRKQVIDGINAGKTGELESLVQKLAKLKAQATMVHLKCIHDTNQILTLEQQGILANL